MFIPCMAWSRSARNDYHTYKQCINHLLLLFRALEAEIIVSLLYLIMWLFASVWRRWLKGKGQSEHTPTHAFDIHRETVGCPAFQIGKSISFLWFFFVLEDIHLRL